jgi:bifunctional DNA-binding transcriptional regulator/antitoxin component of YhaV-PrlF toxin-antitoxin module
MRIARISQGGQIQVPAEVRRRWGTREVILEDEGRMVTIRPLPDDPIGAAAGSLAGPGPTSDESRRRWRAEEAEIEARKLPRPSSTRRR